MTLSDRIWWLLSFPFGGIAAWLFDHTRIFPTQILLGLMIGRKPRRVER